MSCATPRSSRRPAGCARCWPTSIRSRPPISCVSASRARPRTPTSCQASEYALAAVGEAGPGGLAGELDRLGVALGLHVAEALRVRVEDHVQLALLDTLVQPGASEDQAANPMDQAATGGPHQLGPVLVDVLTQGGGGLPDLAIHRELEEVDELVAPKALVDEVELDRGL